MVELKDLKNYQLKTGPKAFDFDNEGYPTKAYFEYTDPGESKQDISLDRTQVENFMKLAEKSGSSLLEMLKGVENSFWFRHDPVTENRIIRLRYRVAKTS